MLCSDSEFVKQYGWTAIDTYYQQDSFSYVYTLTTHPEDCDWSESVQVISNDEGSSNVTNEFREIETLAGEINIGSIQKILELVNKMNNLSTNHNLWRSFR